MSGTVPFGYLREIFKNNEWREKENSVRVCELGFNVGFTNLFRLLDLLSVWAVSQLCLLFYLSF